MTRVHVPPFVGQQGDRPSAQLGGGGGAGMSFEALAEQLCMFRNDVSRMLTGLTALSESLKPVPKLLGQIRDKVEGNTDRLVEAIGRIDAALEKGDKLITKGEEINTKGNEVVEEAKRTREFAETRREDLQRLVDLAVTRGNP